MRRVRGRLANEHFRVGVRGLEGGRKGADIVLIAGSDRIGCS